MFMPRWASRLTLTVTDVRVQRVQEISQDDACAEGIKLHCLAGACGWIDYLEKPDQRSHRYYSEPRDSFRTLWDNLNAKRGYGWDENPWVCAVTFDVHRCNIDQIGERT